VRRPSRDYGFPIGIGFLAAVIFFFLGRAPISDQAWAAFLFCYIGAFLLLKAVLIRRGDAISDSLAATNLVLGASYAWAGLNLIWPHLWIENEWVIWTIRIAVSASVTWSGAVLLRIWWLDGGPARVRARIGRLAAWLRHKGGNS
jgi:hypothetical protein